MKLVINLLLTLCALNAFAEPAGTNRPLERLKALYDTGTMPSNIKLLVSAVSQVKSCAGGASEAYPDNLNTNYKLSILTYSTSSDLGPVFPPQVFDYIVVTEASRSYSIYSPISGYSITNVQNAVHITAKEYSTELDCSDPDPDIPCSYDTVTKDVVLDIRNNQNYLVFKATQNNTVAYFYCWK